MFVTLSRLLSVGSIVAMVRNISNELKLGQRPCGNIFMMLFLCSATHEFESLESLYIDLVITSVQSGLRSSFSLQSKVDSQRQMFFEDFIYSQIFCQKFAEINSLKKYFSYFILLEISDLVPEPRPHV